ncbi:MAG TPA: T9SS type A sorting domain-containing protein [Bacteroidia bacterium]|nr:T9SS type A sorting domain-containing protein [Bacteroidia bacterium]
MKQFTFSIVLILVCKCLSAQIILTKSFNEPIPGDVNLTAECDSTFAIPKTTGLNQLWDFSSLKLKSSSILTTYSLASAATPSANFPGATLVAKTGTSFFFYSNASSSQFEWLGWDWGYYVNLTNSLISQTWPFSYGDNYSDSYSGFTSAIPAESLTGTETLLGSGAGTIVLPGGIIYNGVLQVLSRRTETFASTQGPTAVQSYTATTYSYYHSSNKFPVLRIQYLLQIFGNSTPSPGYSIQLNKSVLTGISEGSWQNNLSLFPNPAGEQVSLYLTNAAHEPVNVEIHNVMGNIVKTLILGTTVNIEETISLRDVPSGIYVVKIFIGKRSFTHKLVKD